MRQACRLTGTELTQTERFALLALRNRTQLFRWERALMETPTMQRLAMQGLAVFENERWEPTQKGIELIARLTGYDLSSIAMPESAQETMPA
ncbi:hypothetical protein [Lysobacter changpingensis]|jgi:hypothetical protein|uniref:hypothetical protein n=1 Tax=Lysobacter changpingensis TaxID=2792784 RepID=UPI001A8DAE76|nr:hypothetical protein [Lysobacter changpingensis]